MNKKKRNSKNNDAYITEKKLVSLYKNLEDMIENVEMYIEHSSKKIKDERQESEKILAKMEETYAKIKKQNDEDVLIEQEEYQSHEIFEKDEIKEDDNDNTEEVEAKTYEEDEKIEQYEEKPSNQSKVGMVRDLHSQGMNIEQISKKMGISQGEVNLIMGIRK